MPPLPLRAGLAGLLALTPPASPGPGATTAAVPLRVAADEDPGDEVLLGAWERLAPDARHDLVEWFRAEARQLESFQSRLVRYALGLEERDPGTWPPVEPPPLYDAERHAPRDPIARRRLEPGSPVARRQAERFLARVPERRLESAWVYDHATRELRRRPAADEDGRLFRNGLAGFPPELDLAEALVERALDDGAQQAALAAFGHAYSDREGHAHPTLTLYDAWASGARMEMPDVECLGLVHDLLEDWSTWKAPVPDRRHDALYEAVAGLFGPAHRHRGLRTALARCFATGEPVQRDGYQTELDRFHALWDEASSTPAQLVERLPDAARQDAFLKDWMQRCRTEPALLARGRERRAVLAADAAAVRALLVRLARESGALDPPTAPPEPADDPPPERGGGG